MANRYTLRITNEGGNILEYRLEKWEELDLVLYIKRFEADLRPLRIYRIRLAEL